MELGRKIIRTKLVAMNEKEKSIYEIIKNNNTVTTEEISVILDTTARTVVRYIRSLREKGYIVREGPNNSGKRNILK
ncbi:MAG: HTH domain-containing protein [Firmicutes bacterium]|nr:HTH domain-containing protein [Bacillota bacterium]